MIESDLIYILEVDYAETDFVATLDDCGASDYVSLFFDENLLSTNPPVIFTDTNNLCIHRSLLELFLTHCNNLNYRRCVINLNASDYYFLIASPHYRLRNSKHLWESIEEIILKDDIQKNCDCHFGCLEGRENHQDLIFSEILAKKLFDIIDEVGNSSFWNLVVLFNEKLLSIREKKADINLIKNLGNEYISSLKFEDFCSLLSICVHKENTIYIDLLRKEYQRQNDLSFIEKKKLLSIKST